MQTVVLQSNESVEPIEVTLTRQAGTSSARGQAAIGDRTIEFDRLNENGTRGASALYETVNAP